MDFYSNMISIFPNHIKVIMTEKKSNSRVCMNLTSSNGTWLNGCLQPQHYYVSLEITDPEGKQIARVALSYEQAARMLLYNGNVECTLERYRNSKGEMVKEEVEKPETVHERMKKRLQESQQSTLDRIKDIHRDLYEMLNGDAKRGKTQIQHLLHEIRTVQSNLEANQNYVLQQAEEELSDMQSNAAGQLGIFLQTKGVELQEDEAKKLLPISSAPLLIGDTKPVEDEYTLKKRESKPIDEMTSMQVADVMRRRLKQLEAQQKDEDAEHTKLFWANASDHKDKVHVQYINYQGTSKLDLEEAKKYLKFLLSIKSINEFKTHYWYNKKEKE